VFAKPYTDEVTNRNRAMPLGNENVLALGNTASVMPSIAKTVDHLYVACPTDVTSVVLQGNDKCFYANELNYPLSISCYEFVRKMSSKFRLFHAELGYSVSCNVAGVPYGIHIHGVTDIELLFPRTPIGVALKRPYRAALKNAEYVVSHPAVVDSIRKLRKDAMTVPLPIDTIQFNDRVKPFKFGTGISIFSPSRMDQWKGHEIIWEALRLMKNREKVTIYQSDWGWEPRYTYFRTHAPDNVQFIAVISRAKIASCYRGADLVIGQMKIGHFGMTELEAVACGAPVLVYLHDEGAPFLPKSGDPKALAEAIDRFVEDGESRKKYADACANYILPVVELAIVSTKFTDIWAASDRRNRGRSVRRTGLFLGSGLEVVGRTLGSRTFKALKSSLIGL